jgi:hypothetical protein
VEVVRSISGELFGSEPGRGFEVSGSFISQPMASMANCQDQCLSLNV